MQLKTTTDALLKPIWWQSSVLKESGLIGQSRTIPEGTVLDLAANESAYGHYAVVLKKPFEGMSNGFIYQGSVDLITAPIAAADNTAVEVYPDDWDLSIDFPSRVIRYCMEKGYRLTDGVRERNLIYIEGVNRDGVPNADRPDHWNDLRLLISFDKKKPYFVHQPMIATTEPGADYTYRPMNKKGAFRIAFGQHRDAWKVGTHGYDYHPALVQKGVITGHRDLNKDFVRTGDKIDIGDDFMVNMHGPYTYNKVGKSSAGCLVGADMSEHLRHMNLVKKDPRYLADNGFLFDGIVIDGDDFNKSKWGYDK